MKKIFILGEQSINDELRKMLGSKCEIADEINNTIDIIIDSTNYPKEKKKENIEYIDKNSGGSVPFFTSSANTLNDLLELGCMILFPKLSFLKLLLLK